MTSNIYVFNQYYLTFIKTIKKNAKNSKDTNAKNIIKSIRLEYNTFNNNSDEYINYFKSNFDNNSIQELKLNENFNEWIEKNNTKYLIKDIELEKINKIIKKKEILTQFLLIFSLFVDDQLNENEIKIIMEKLKGNDNDDNLPQRHKDLINKITKLNIKNSTGFSIEEIEDTSIGKLAKEIVNEIDLDKVKSSIENDGDILGALGNPDNGIGNLISDVSQKMASKLKNGDIKQENLLNDAIKMAGKLPGLGGSNSNGNEPDIGNIMKMMSSMMGNNNMGGNINKGKMKNMQKKMETKSRLKKKLDDKNKET